MIRAVALASGSNGNAVWVETADLRLLVDAGLSGKRLAERAAERGVDLDRAQALLVTHNHHDHVSGAGVVHRRHGPPLLMTAGTHAACRHALGVVSDLRTFRAGEALRFGRTLVQTFSTPHDGVDGVCVVVEAEGARVGVLTDLGHPFARLTDLLPTLDAAFLEANYDPEMLESGPYPRELKDRIAGPRGHLSNRECVELARVGAQGRLRQVMLAHLSGENNSPRVAMAEAEILSGTGLVVGLAPRDAPSPRIAVEV